MTAEKRQASGGASLSGELLSGFGIKIERYDGERKLLLVSGARSVLCYLPEFLELDMGAGFLIVRGRSLLARTFLSGSVEIVGKIAGIEFSDLYVKPEASEG